MIGSENCGAREKALAKLLPMQRAGLEACTRPWRARPSPSASWIPSPRVLPTAEEDIVALAKEMNMTVEKLKVRTSPPSTSSTHDGPPRLPSGCHLPEIAAMQTRAVIEAAVNVQKATPTGRL